MKLAVFWVFVLFAAMLFPVVVVFAQSTDLPRLSLQLAKVERSVRSVDAALDTRIDNVGQQSLRIESASALDSAEEILAQLQIQHGLVQARISGLGGQVSGVPETPDIRRQRMDLTGQRNGISTAIRRSSLAAVEARQLIGEIDRLQSEQFSQTLSQRVLSPLTPPFWRAVVRSVPRDIRRIELFSTLGVEQIKANWRGGWPWQALLGLLLGGIVLFPMRSFARYVGQRYLIEGAPGHRLRRSANASWRVLVGTLAPLIAAALAVQGFRWAGLLPSRWDDLLDALVGAFGFGGFTASVGSAMLMGRQPSWRVAPIDDVTAARLRPLSWFLAILSGVTITITAFNNAVGAGQPAQVMTQVVAALLYQFAVITLLCILGRRQRENAQRSGRDSATARAGLGILLLAMWALAAASAILLGMGYVSLGMFIAALIGWTTVLGSALYLAMAFADDLATTLLSRESHLGVALARSLGIRVSVVEQFGLVLSGVVRLSLLVLALGILLTPFGAGGGLDSILGRFDALSVGVKLGGVTVSPFAIVRGIVVFGIGLALVKAFMGWLERRYLPATDLDGSGRNSISLVARYVGIGLAGIWSLASLGIGIERVAILLSALSVGIGFGLQAITQNFISGLILLAERPIKIGDLIRVGTDEGDVKRISVRSTEIELGDHSTLIVPNSELITKSVLNKTVAGRLGRIQIQFSVPIETDPEIVAKMAFEAMTSEVSVLEDPEPAVFIDGIQDGRIVFNCFAHVTSPRSTYASRSRILMTLLTRVRERGIELGTVPQKLDFVNDEAGSPPKTPPAHQARSRGGETR